VIRRVGWMNVTLERGWRKHKCAILFNLGAVDFFNYCLLVYLHFYNCSYVCEFFWPLRIYIEAFETLSWNLILFIEDTVVFHLKFISSGMRV
jgi:hypothetical protein